MKLLSGVLVAAFGCYLIALATMTVTVPQLAKEFLTAFASSARAHYTEQTLRLIAGAAIVVFSPWMWLSDLFKVFGWLIFVTAVGMFLVPWRWHHRFGEWAIPLAIRHLRLFAVGAFVLGALILHGISRAILS